MRKMRAQYEIEIREPSRRAMMMIGCLAAFGLLANSARGEVVDADSRLLQILGRPVQKPATFGEYVPVRRSGNLVFLSTTPAKTGKAATYPRIVGRDLDLAQAKIAARGAALTLLEGLWFELGGTLKPVRQWIALTGYVASADGQGYFGYSPDPPAFVEILPYSKILNDAKIRNTIFFKTLGITSEV
jgi:hypothetical protein